LRNRVRPLNPGIKIMEISCKTGEGIGEWITWLRKEVDGFRFE
jgi:hydrogenase nickel incorporation protein HypB